MKPLSLAQIRCALVVAPHPDDETIGAYGLIRAVKARGARVRVVVVTDGAGSHPNSARWPRERLVAERRRETRAAMRAIGVAAGDVTFLALPDGCLCDRRDDVRRTLRREVARCRGVDLVVLPATDDDHPDHRVSSGMRVGLRRLDYLVWPGRGRPSRPASHRLRLGTFAAAKRGAIRRYRSQMGAITDDAGGFAISRADLARFARPVERFRELRR